MGKWRWWKDILSPTPCSGSRLGMSNYSDDNDAALESAEYPPTSFYFSVSFSGANMDSDTSFQEVSGISRKIETEDVAEGGENRFVHHLPKAVKYENLVLKRGIASMRSELVKWCRKVLEDGLGAPITTQGIDVFLMNADGEAIRAWAFSNAYPVKWSVDGFNSTENKVSIETIELCYSTFRRLDAISSKAK